MALICVAAGGCSSPAPPKTPPVAVESSQPGWTSEPESPPVEVSAQEPATPPPEPEFTTGDPGELEPSLAHHYAAMLAGETAPLENGDVGYYMDTQEARLIQLLQKSGVAAVRSGDTLALTLGNGVFTTGSTRLSAEAREKLTPVAQVLVEYDRTRISIYGHTDNTGDPAYNQHLSVRRAASLAHFLAESGVARQRIFVAGLGASQPIASNDTEAGRAQNRRIELKVEPLVTPVNESEPAREPDSR